MIVESMVFAFLRPDGKITWSCVLSLSFPNFFPSYISIHHLSCMLTQTRVRELFCKEQIKN